MTIRAHSVAAACVLLAGCAEVLGYGDVVLSEPDASTSDSDGADASAPNATSEAGGSGQGC